MNFKISKTVLIAALILLLSLAVSFPLYNMIMPDINLVTNKSVYRHYDFVEVYAQPKNENIEAALETRELLGFVYKDSSIIDTVGYRTYINLSYNVDSDCWIGKWPVPWNAVDGEYEVRLAMSPGGVAYEVTPCTFHIKRRKPVKFGHPVCAMNLEYMKPFKNIRLRGPDGTVGDWRNFLAWSEYAGADTFFMLAGQTSAYTEKMDNKFPWNSDNLSLLEEIARESHKRGMKFGAWVAVYLTFGPGKFSADYEYSLNYDLSKDRLIPTRGISLGDEDRIQDTIEFIKKLNDIPEIDYIGLDYIRNVKGGFELVDEFVRDMEIELPSNKELLVEENRMKWLGRIVYSREEEDLPVIYKWNWWRASKVARIVKEIKDRSGLKKPLWLFTLSWEKGWQHGQDVIMMNDAGADMCAIMMYECDSEQFARLIKNWHSYSSREEVQLIVGNQIDWYVHQDTMDPPGPEMFFDRIIESYSNIYRNGNAYGVFSHDISRACWGRKGPYSTIEWVVPSAASFSRVREDYGVLPFEAVLEVKEQVELNEEFTATVKLAGLVKEELNIIVNIITARGVEVLGPSTLSPVKDEPGKAEFTLKINEILPGKGLKYMIAAKIDWDNYGDFNENFVFEYVTLRSSVTIITPVPE